MRITVFGGARPRPGDEAYAQALKLGHALGAAGHTVLTGGYSGTMEAVSRGANESGGHVIGVTCDEIESWRPLPCNAWVQEEVRCDTLRSRIFTLFNESDAALALPGGIGTLAEISLMWNYLLTGQITARPLIVIGPGWRHILLDTFLTEQGVYIPAAQRVYVQFAADVDEALLLMNGHLEQIHQD